MPRLGFVSICTCFDIHIFFNYAHLYYYFYILSNTSRKLKRGRLTTSAFNR